MEATPEMMAAFAKFMASGKGKRTKKSKGKGRAKPTPEQSAEYVAANDNECIKVFTAAGYKDVKPRVNVLTHKRWVAAGRMVRKGEKALQVGTEGHKFNLFHIDQTDPLLVPDKAA